MWCYKGVILYVIRRSNFLGVIRQGHFVCIKKRCHFVCVIRWNQFYVLCG